MASIVIHKSASRGQANHGWLQSRHSFSFAGYHHPDRMHFGALRVLNDDIVAPSMGFGTHPHDNMEIVSIPLKGALRHQDSTGRKEIIHTQDVQIMSAGTGIRHSEFNASAEAEVNFLQLWIFPQVANIPPRYEQKTFREEDRQNKFQVVVSPVKEEGSVWINQDAWISMAQIEAGQSINYVVHRKDNGVYFFIVQGTLGIEGHELEARDAIGISTLATIPVAARQNSTLLAIEVPMEFN